MQIRAYPVVLLVLVALGIAGCGGGGGGGTVTPVAPAAPGGVKAAQDPAAVAISWTPVSGATSYNVYRATATGVNKSNYTERVTGASNPYIFTGLTNNTAYYFVVTAVSSAGESAESTQVSATPVAAATDPLYSQQWHLTNLVTAVEDINADGAWAQTCGATSCRGDGVRVAVVDDGLEIGHEDLAFNVVAGQSYNYVTGSVDPSPSDIYSAHGTAVGGTIAARDMNGKGGRGVAPRAGLVGYNLLSGFSLSNELDAMTRNAAVVDISSNSWGPPDGYGLLFESDPGWRSAIDTGLTNGRNGLGTVYVWAGGNGYPFDNSNFDGLANYRGVIAVAAITDSGTASSYSERGANLWVSAPAGNFCDSSRTIVTTDLMGTAGYNNNGTSAIDTSYNPEITTDGNYTKCFNGTSAATPVVSGTVALMLQANPSLTWRDVRLILAETTRQNNPSSNADGIGWQTGAATPAGATVANYRFHHDYGFGAVDANAAVTRAKTWTTNVGFELTPCTVTGSTTNNVIDPNGAVATNTAVVSGCAIGKIEFVEITFTSNHTYAGDLQIDLVSPAGITSRLAEVTICNDGSQGIACFPYDGWVFGSAFHLGEAANGTWTLNVRDMYSASDTGNITAWSLKFYGRAN